MILLYYRITLTRNLQFVINLINKLFFSQKIIFFSTLVVIWTIDILPLYLLVKSVNDQRVLVGVINLKEINLTKKYILKLK